MAANNFWGRMQSERNKDTHSRNDTERVKRGETARYRCARTLQEGEAEEDLLLHAVGEQAEGPPALRRLHEHVHALQRDVQGADEHREDHEQLRWGGGERHAKHMHMHTAKHTNVDKV